MNLLSSISAQSSLGEKCAFYLDTVAGNIPVSLHTLARRFVTKLELIRSTTSLHALSQSLDATDIAILLTTLIGIVTIALMPWRSGGFLRRSPYNGRSTPPHVSESDYTYIRPEDIVDPPSHRHHEQQYRGTSETDPDVLLLRHHRDSYRLQFPAYAIDDGTLSVGDLRQRAAEVTQTSNLNRIKLLYKGKLLSDDSRACKAEGLKQNSEVLCVASKVHPGQRTPSDGSEVEAGPVRLGDGPEGTSGSDSRGRKQKNKKGKKKNGSKNRPTDQPPDPTSLAPPMSKRPSSSGRSSAPSPAPSLTSFRTSSEQVHALESYFRGQLLPLCEEYIAHPPTEPKARDFEHKKLGETILAQVILKADGIDPDGNEEARNARRALIKETQSTLSRLDQAAKQ